MCSCWTPNGPNPVRMVRFVRKKVVHVKMLRFLRYCISHCLHAAMTRLEEVNGEVTMWSSVRWLGYLSGLNMLLGLCLGLYARWEVTADSFVLVVFVLALFVLGTACVLYYYFNMERVSLSLLHLWFGFLLGLLSFLNPPTLDVKGRVANYLLLASVALRTLWALVERLLGCTRYRPAFLTSAERLELTGFAAASTALLITESFSVMVLLVALATVMITLRTKALMAIPSFTCFTVITADWFFKSLSISTNPFALACFFSQLICDPLLDFYFSGLSGTERWRSFLVSSGVRRRLSLLPLLVVEVAFIALSSQRFTDLGQWYLVIPGFVACVLFWAICHTVFVITVWGFHTKLSDCQRLCWTQGPEDSSLEKIMASKGMRHFCLISVRLVTFALVSTVAVAVFCWQVRTIEDLTSYI
ncbi:hypothetical protein XENOCAPTIV_010484 [Xenoophorus captivus]|uniref:Transmembrane protein 168b n=1 Tax=Xenoophorus captivus TaxID=1517983 RepID=A0ABV0S1T1_9TELE